MWRNGSALRLVLTKNDLQMTHIVLAMPTPTQGFPVIAASCFKKPGCSSEIYQDLFDPKRLLHKSGELTYLHKRINRKARNTFVGELYI
jgi:hypothetical protein